MHFISKRSPSFLIIIAPIFVLSGCVPIMLGGGLGAAGYTAMKEKSVGDSVSDTKIEAFIKSRLYRINRELCGNTSISVDRGCVLLTGAVNDPAWPPIAERESWKSQGVTVVDNNIIVGKTLGISEIMLDGAITSRVRGALMCNSNVKSVNYKIKTTDGVVYVRGHARSQLEINSVLRSIQHVRGVKKVVSYITVPSK
jgi:hyperosmotically inducible protein